MAAACASSIAGPAVLKAEPEVKKFDEKSNRKSVSENIIPCPSIFKGNFCNYTGLANWCDGSFRRCREIGNVKYFGGYPVIGVKKLTVIDVSSIGDIE